MRRLLAGCILACLAAARADAAQLPPPSEHLDAPWWMAQPIIASTGEVRVRLPANRARFAVSYRVVAPTAEAAMHDAADKVRGLAVSLAGLGSQTVQLETSFSTQPLYQQFKEKTGELVDNARADKVVAYQVDGRMEVSVQNVALVQNIYATSVSTRPTTIETVYFSLEPDDETNTQLFKLSVADAARRARMAAEAAGARLGSVRLIDPTGRACETDVLVAGASRSYGAGRMAMQEAIMSPASAPPPPSPPPPPPGSDRVMTAEELPVQPPVQELRQSSCVIYALQ